MGICSSIQKNTFQTVTYENLSTTVEYSEADIEILESSNLKNIPFLVLQKATKKFHLNSRVSEDGTGCIFKGQIEDKSLNSSIPEMANKAILVKLFWDNNFITRKQFLTGIEFLTRFDHPNLVNLVGYCLDASHMLLVLEFMAQGSLQNHLFKSEILLLRGNSTFKPLSWNNRVKIALDAAKGLAYLHSDKINVIFRNFKSSNILLDENYNAKLYGLELVRKGPEGDDDHVSTLVMGTYGYAAPEYIATGRLTTKCDVYAFGAFLIEMLTSCRYNKLIFKDETCVEKKESLLKIIDVEIEGQYSIDEALKVADLAMECLSVEPTDRPNMSQVVGLLEQLLFNPIGKFSIDSSLCNSN